MVESIHPEHLKRIASSKDRSFHGPFDNVKINGQTVNNLFIKNNDGNLEFSTKCPYQINGVIIPKEDRNKFKNGKVTGGILLKTKDGQVVSIKLDPNKPDKVAEKKHLSQQAVDAMKAIALNNIKASKTDRDIALNYAHVKPILGDADKKVFAKAVESKQQKVDDRKITDVGKALEQDKTLSKAKSHHKELSTMKSKSKGRSL